MLTTIRNVEVVADPTHVLALECARKRSSSDSIDATPVHRAYSHRVVRGQRYRSAEALSHFRLFSLCSAGRTTGSRRFELDAMTQHLRVYLTALRAFLGSDVPLRVTIMGDPHQPCLYTAYATQSG